MGHQLVTSPLATWRKQFVRFIHGKLLFFSFPYSVLCERVTKSSTDSCRDSRLSPIWRGEELHMLLGIALRKSCPLSHVFIYSIICLDRLGLIFILDFGLYSNTTLFILFLKWSQHGYWELFQVGVCVPLSSCFLTDPFYQQSFLVLWTQYHPEIRIYFWSSCCKCRLLDLNDKNHSLDKARKT